MTTVERLIAEEFKRSGRSFFGALQERLREFSTGPRSALLDHCIDVLSSGTSLTDAEATAAFREMLVGEVAGDQIGALLVALQAEDLPASMIAAFATVLREHV